MNVFRFLVVTAIGLTLFLFLNNTAGMIYSRTSWGSSVDYFSRCSSLHPDAANGTLAQNSDGSSTPAAEAEYQLYNKCLSDGQLSGSQNVAKGEKVAFVIAMLVLLLLVTAAIRVITQYPDYGTALVLAGILFALLHPFFTIFGTGVLSSFGYQSPGTEITQAVALMKVLSSFIAFIGLSALDLLRLEKNQTPSK